MNMNDAMDFLTNEGIRLQALNMSKSSAIFSTMLENGDIARMTISVDIVRAQQQQQQKPQPQQPGQAQSLQGQR
jgi:hypothetical protein